MTSNITTLELIRKIILGYLTTLDENRVNVYNQKFKIPDDDDLFVTISYRFGKVISSISTCSQQTNYVETIDLTMLEDLSIQIMSKNLSALQTKEFFVMALNSYYSQQIQMSNSFRIMRIAPINDLSSLEGAARLYRFDIPIRIYAWYEKITPADFYNSFNFQIIANGDPEMETVIISQPTTQPIL